MNAQHRIETRELLGGAYYGRHHKRLTHAVEVGPDGRELRVLCERAALGSISDQGAGGDKGLNAVPTCAVCARRRAAILGAG